MFVKIQRTRQNHTQYYDESQKNSNIYMLITNPFNNFTKAQVDFISRKLMYNVIAHMIRTVRTCERSRERISPVIEKHLSRNIEILNR